MNANENGVLRRIIVPPAGWLSINFREIWRYRELLYFLSWRDVKIRYKQTVLGFLWAFLQPFIQLVVFSVIFGRLIGVKSDGGDYPVFLFTGLLPWQFFSEILSRSSQSVVTNANLLTKVYFPRLIIPLASAGACLVDFVISFTILAGLMFYYHVPLTLSFLAVIPLTFLTAFIALGAGILLSGLSATYRDFKYAIPFGMQVWLYVTPVVYSVKVFPARWQWLVSLNPMAGIVDAYRAAILNRPMAWENLGISVAVGVALFVVGIFYFRRMEKTFADVV